jgi:hypothetical protein
VPALLEFVTSSERRPFGRSLTCRLQVTYLLTSSIYQASFEASPHLLFSPLEVTQLPLEYFSGSSLTQAPEMFLPFFFRYFK